MSDQETRINAVERKIQQKTEGFQALLTPQGIMAILAALGTIYALYTGRPNPVDPAAADALQALTRTTKDLHAQIKKLDEPAPVANVKAPRKAVAGNLVVTVREHLEAEAKAMEAAAARIDAVVTRLGVVKPAEADVPLSPLPAPAPAPGPVRPVESMTSEAQPATLTVELPDANATLAINGMLRPETGKVRTFTTGPLMPGNYTYTVTARWEVGGQPITKEKIVTFAAGQKITVTFP